MADDSLSIKFSLDPSEAVAGAQAFEKELNDVVAAAQKLGTVGDSPRALIQSSAQATLAVEELRKKLAATGQPISPALAASLKSLEDRAAGAAKRAGDLKEALDNTRKAGAAASQGAEAMRGAFGSVDGVLQQLKASGSAAGASFADMGLKAAGVFAAFQFGYDVGKKLDAQMKELGVDLSRLPEALAKVGDWFNRTGGAVEGATGAFDEFGEAVKKTGGLLEPLTGNVNAVIKAHQAAARVVQEMAGELKKLGVEWKSASGEAEKLAKTTALLTTALAESEKKGEDAAATAAANAGALLKVRDEYEKQGIALSTLDPKLQKAITLAEQMKAVQEANAAAAKALRESYGELGTGIEEVTTKTESLADAQLREAEAMDALNESMIRLEERQVRQREEAHATEEVYAHMEIIQTGLMRATDAQTESLERQIDTFRRLHEELGSGADRLEDYAATMKAAFESGAMSLIAFDTQMQMTINQLDILIARNAGNAFAKDMEKMVAALRELKRAVDWGEIKPAERLRL
jgi:chromosome segregation ATPase